MRRSRKSKQKSPYFFTKKKNNNNNNNHNNAADDAAARGIDGGGGGGGGRFFGCYLLTSLSPRHKGHTYIGFTVNPKRRIRQHNGEITSGASKTKRKRPWEMVLCIHGFPTNVSALQFEWAWQHPKDSVAVRETAATFKTLGGLTNKIKLALTMLTLPSWQSLDLTVSIFSTNYMKYTAGCPTLPRQMKLHFSSLDDLPCYSDPHYPCASDHDADHDDEIHSNSSHHLGDTPEFGFVETNPSTDTQSHHLDDTPEFGFVETYHLDGTPEFGFVETNPSTDTQSYTLHNTPEPELVREHQVIGRPSDEQDKCPADVHDSGDELHCLGDNGTPFGSYSYKFSDNIFPVLKKHVSPSHHHSSTESNSNDYLTPSQKEPFRQPHNLMKDQLSAVDYVLIDESPLEKHQPTGKYLHTSSTDTVEPRVRTQIEQVEVIDLYTPSPYYRIGAASKKRKFSSSCSNFIDLTKSPLFIEQ
ncbi:hypothetical protein vseg_020639 [Gypsophila vaccaria]